MSITWFYTLLKVKVGWYLNAFFSVSFLSSHSMDEISQFDSVAGVWTLFACH